MCTCLASSPAVLRWTTFQVHPRLAWFLSCFLGNLPVPGKPRILVSLPKAFSEALRATYTALGGSLSGASPLLVLCKLRIVLSFSSYKNPAKHLTLWDSSSQRVGSQSAGFSIPYELTRNVNPWATPQT